MEAEQAVPSSFVTKRRIKIWSAISSEILILIYNFFHTGATLARYVDPPFVGYLCALGIEIAVFGLSFRIGDLERAGQDAKGTRRVLYAVLAVSTAANISEGFNVRYGRALTLATIEATDVVQAVIGLLSTGLISVVGFAMSDIISADFAEDGTVVTAPVKRAVKPQAPVKPGLFRRVVMTFASALRDLNPVSSTAPVPTAPPAPAPTPEPTPPAPQPEPEPETEEPAPAPQPEPVPALGEEWIDALAEEIPEHLPEGLSEREAEVYRTIRASASPNWSEVARSMGVSRQSVHTYKSALLERGTIQKQGDLWIANGVHA